MADAANRGILRDLALRLDKSSLTYANECMRFRFEESADVLALMASHGELTYQEVLTVVGEVLAGHRTPDQAAAALDPYALSALMRLIAGLRADGELMGGDFAHAADVGQVARLIQGDVRFSVNAARVEGQVNLACGRFAHVEQMLAEDELTDDTRWMLSTELAHPANGATGASQLVWLKRFNARFDEFGLLPISIASGEGAAFDRVTVDVPPDRNVADGPLITVIMSTFRPDQSFRTAVESLLRQTWRNLEILVIDDCSPPEYDGLLADVTGLDPRIEFLRMPVNGGTYRIRNEGIRRSRGAFVTFQDSDDWAHPERLERQMAPLLERSELVATHCRCVRVFADLTTLNVGMNAFRRCAPSTMFRKDVVIERLGAYDETRKEADNEFYERLKVVFGEGSVLDLRDPLVLYQLSAGSLSRDEYRFGWQHGARTVYIEARRHWHREIAAGRQSPRLDPSAPRRIPAPTRVLTGRDPEPAQCDVLWISDWRNGFARYDGTTRLVEATGSAGFATLVAHTTALRNAHRDRVHLRDDLLSLQANGATRLVVWSEPTQARLAIITDPELLNLTRPPEQIGIRAGRLVIAAAQPPTAPGGEWLTYAPAVVEANARRMFDTGVDWLPASEAIADDLRRHGCRSVLAPAPLAVAPPLRERPYRGARGGEALVVGTCGLDPRRRDRPSIATLTERLPMSNVHDVRVLDARLAATQRRKPRSMPPSWVALDGDIDDRGFLRQLDVLAVVPTRTWGPQVSPTVLLALAEGTVVVADPALESHLGGAALYAEPGGVELVLKQLAADPAAVDEQRARGYAWCRDRASVDALTGLVGTLLAGRRESR